MNPADLLSRGIVKPEQLNGTNKQGTSWYCGPAFLYENVEWPSPVSEQLDEGDPEIKKKQVLLAFGTFQSSDLLIDVKRFSSWIRLQRTVSWLSRFIYNARMKKGRRGQISCQELQAARNLIIKLVQTEAFESEIDVLSNKGEVLRSILTPLSPFLDDKGIMRVRGRLRRMPVADEVKYPIILPKVHDLTDLIVSYV